MDKINFQGRSQLMFDSKIYNQWYNKTQSVYKHVSNEVTRQIPKFSTYTVEADTSNVILYMGNEKTGILRNIPLFNTDLDQIDNLTLRDLTHQADELVKTAKEKLTVWIIGGDKIKGENGNKTVKTINDLAETLCDREDVDGNILSGIQDITNKVVFHQAGGKLNVIIGNDINIKSPEISETGLLRYYNIVELNNVTAG